MGGAGPPTDPPSAAALSLPFGAAPVATLPKALAALGAGLAYALVIGLVLAVLLGAGGARLYSRWHRRHDMATRLARLRI